MHPESLRQCTFCFIPAVDIHDRASWRNMSSSWSFSTSVLAGEDAFPRYDSTVYNIVGSVSSSVCPTKGPHQRNTNSSGRAHETLHA